MTIDVKVVLDSVWDTRITTLQLRYPRIIHSEFMTHRMFSRNASSSRAVPVQRLIEDVERDPYIPMAWGQNRPGMQAREELDPVLAEAARKEWCSALDDALAYARRLAGIGAHKQHVNRLLEPFSHINVVTTATEWDNFLALRDHPDAQPEMQELAKAIRYALETSEPAQAIIHLPYADHIKDLSAAWRVSAARAARVSYLTHDGRTPTMHEDLELADRLLNSMHMSPFEHAAMADDGWHANYDGWRSYRHIL